MSSFQDHFVLHIWIKEIMNLNALLLLRKQILNWFATPNVVYFVLEYIEVQLIRTKEYKAKTLHANVSICLPFFIQCNVVSI